MKTIGALWAQHAGDPEGTADEISALLHEVTEPGPVAALVVHVEGEHLGRWDGGLEKIAVLEGRFPGDEGLARARATLQLCRDGALDGKVPALARVHAVAASAVAAHGRLDEAARWFEFARAGVRGLPDSDPTVRSVAITANNLAVELAGSPASPARDRLLLQAAHAARAQWERAGTWVNVERAEYRLAHSYVVVGDGESALRHADHCLEICEANAAGAIEWVFGHEARALALDLLGREVEAELAAARSQLEAVDQENRGWVAAEVRKLGERLHRGGS